MIARLKVFAKHWILLRAKKVNKLTFMSCTMCTAAALWYWMFYLLVNTRMHPGRQSFLLTMTSWRRTLSALVVLCAGNQRVTGGFLQKGPLVDSFGVFFVSRLKSCSLSDIWKAMTLPWRHCVVLIFTADVIYQDNSQTLVGLWNYVDVFAVLYGKVILELTNLALILLTIRPLGQFILMRNTHNYKCG